ncbi:hypothetical protein WR25_26094 [Diploscapter pachys]|uniref:Uncharacterized protein n=1 Tax=Diploscapter pachys TaxID=2018661 RepID=A0A2A2J5W5_9BILA|nr:hypothetical protein WR25_26094 [Diploscapter pachys]
MLHRVLPRFLEFSIFSVWNSFSSLMFTSGITGSFDVTAATGDSAAGNVRFLLILLRFVVTRCGFWGCIRESTDWSGSSLNRCGVDVALRIWIVAHVLIDVVVITSRIRKRRELEAGVREIEPTFHQNSSSNQRQNLATTRVQEIYIRNSAWNRPAIIDDPPPNYRDIMKDIVLNPSQLNDSSLPPSYEEVTDQPIVIPL